MKLKNLKINTQFILGLFIPLIFIIVLGVVAHSYSSKLKEQIDMLYHHPLIVGRAVGMFRADIYALHRDMKDLSLANNYTDITVEKDWINWWKEDAATYIVTIDSNYLGPRNDVDLLKLNFDSLKYVCDKTIELMNSGGKAETYSRTKTFGIVGSRVEKLIEKLQVIFNFSIKKGDELYAQSLALDALLSRQLTLLIAFIILFLIIVNIILYRNISKPLSELTNVAKRFHKGDRNARSSYISQNEFGILSTSFNDLAENALRLETTNMEAVFESSPVAMFVIDERTNIVLTNLAFDVMCGKSESEILQHRPGNALRCVHSNTDPRGCGYSNECKFCNVRNGVETLIANGGSMHGAELELELTRNGKPGKFWMKIGVEPFTMNGRQHWCIAMDDVTERKRIEKNSNSLLENSEHSRNMLLHILEDQKLVQEALQENERKYMELFDNAPVGYHELDVDGRITQVNQTELNMLGYTKEEMIGQFVWNFLVDENISKQRVLDKLKGIRSAAEGEERIYYRKDKTAFPVIVGDKILRDETNHIIGVRTTLQDITERKRTEEEITMLAHSLRSVNECVSITDLDDKIIFVNESFLKTYGYDENELIGIHMSIVRSPSNPHEKVKEILPATLRGGWQGELWNKRKDGNEFPIYLSTTIINDKNGNSLGLIGVAVDITERKFAEKELIDAKERAEKSDKLKTEFLAQMSHEIRSPMNAILSFANLIKEDIQEKLSPEDLNFFAGIDIAGQRLMRTVDLILNASEMQVGTYEPTFNTFDLIRDIIESIKCDYERLVKEKGLKINLVSEVHQAMITGDKYSIQQIFVNLVDNAVKYTKDGSITINVAKKKKEIKVIIEDTGIGMSEEFMAQMYHPFSQEERGYSRRFEGNGLGLSLVKKYCELNGITIEVESKKMAGTKFTLTFTRTH